MALETLSASNEPDFKLGEWWVRPQRNEMERRDEIVHIEARSMSVLVCLARHAPDVTSKKRLLDEVWKDAYVGEEVVSHAIWELRKALGDSARDPVYIQTVPRRGYRLLQEVLRPSGSPMPLEGVRVDHYEIQGELGRGSMGVVYKAVDQRLGRTVAVKFLAPELTRDIKACRRFTREARLAASLDHPNLATVYEVGETSQGNRYLVTAFYQGGTLKERLNRKPIPVAEALELAKQLAAGLNIAHKRGIIHRDIKPANLILDEHGILKIADFGIAKLQGGTDLTSTGATLGTPAYKSPEQSQGQSIDHRTDIWSMGVVLFEMLSGRRPFDGEFEQAVVHSILSNNPEIDADAGDRPIPDTLCRVVAKAIAKHPGERYQSASEMIEALDGIDLQEQTTAPRSSERRLPGSAKIVLAFSILVLAVFSAAVIWRHSSPSAAVSAKARAHLEQGLRSWPRGNDEANLQEAGMHFQKAVDEAPDGLKPWAISPCSKPMCSRCIFRMILWPRPLTP